MYCGEPHRDIASRGAIQSPYLRRDFLAGAVQSDADNKHNCSAPPAHPLTCSISPQDDPLVVLYAHLLVHQSAYTSHLCRGCN